MIARRRQVALAVTALLTAAAACQAHARHEASGVVPRPHGVDVVRTVKPGAAAAAGRVRGR